MKIQYGHSDPSHTASVCCVHVTSIDCLSYNALSEVSPFFFVLWIFLNRIERLKVYIYILQTVKPSEINVCF